MPLQPPAPPPAACTRVASRTSLAALSGRRIGALTVVTQAPPALAGRRTPMDRLHVRTREGTVRRLLLVAPGDTVDTLRVAESLRRIRRQRYLQDALIEGTACEGVDGPVALTVTTRDDWSTKPSAQLRSASSSVGVTERNVLGTGRELSAYVRSDAGRVGVGASLRDPWLVGSPLSAELAFDTFADGHAWYVGLGTRVHDPRDPYRANVGFAARTRLPTDGSGIAVRQTTGQALGSARVHLGATAVTSVLAGVEIDRTSLVASAGQVVLGPGAVKRDFRGVDVGLARTALRYDTLTWMLPGARIVDVPTTPEGEMTLGVGRDVATGNPALHLDLWAGRAWRVGDGALLVADLWSGGFLERRRVEAGSLRGNVSARRDAGRGLWTARLSAERLWRPDPTVRALASLDPTAPALPADVRLASVATAVQLERSFPLLSATRSWSLAGTGFVAGSMRWRPAAPGLLPEVEQVGIASVGLGIGLTPNKPGRGGARLDVAYPVLSPPGALRRPYVMISLSPWFQEGRRRAGITPH